MEGPKFSKRKALGKNKKKSWRAIDITATEDFLEDQRFQLRTTGLFAEKTDDQLFLVERQSSDKTEKEAVPKRRTKRELNCYSNLINRSRIQCPRKEYPTSETYNTRSLRSFERKADTQKTPVTTTTKQPKSAKTDAVDLWAEDKTEAEGDEFFNEVTKQRRVQPPKHIKRKCSQRSVVETPHPGASVNPAYDDHQDLLLQAHVVEVKKEKAERKVYNALDAQFPSASEAPTEASWIKEMSAGLYEEPGTEKEEVDDSHISINPPVNREKKKTPRERRKEKTVKLMKQVMEQTKLKKGTENKVYSITKIRSELSKEKKEMMQRGQLKAKKQEEKKYAPKKLGKTKMVVPDMDLKLSDELVGNLRSLKPEGHLLEDRYKSLQMRNLLEPRAKAHKKKTKTKKFEKKSFREVTI